MCLFVGSVYTLASREYSVNTPLWVKSDQRRKMVAVPVLTASLLAWVRTAGVGLLSGR